MKRILIAVITALFVSLLGIYELPLHAAPSVTECTKNPELEGCGSSSLEGEEVESDQNSDQSTSLVWNILKLIFALLVVLALIYGLLKLFNKRNKLFQKNKTMETLGGITLAPNRSLQAVRIGEKYYVVGVGDSIDLITEITDSKTIENLNKNEDSELMSKGADQLKIFRKKGRSSSTEKASTVQFQNLFEQQLKEMRSKRKSLSNREDDT
ncbi:flagellar biosynthetic protein FliO [Halobacillus sp. A5]|uniref:flagellar biosynthetic protein FliO n=1 Tax=Halobacillus sp. A5 TaxID=2880263 RepID=UPI0020A661F2|nr:flagellar biosynthetic protein FliO [Halobacillus sp. A5]MCP3026110.1 flagellar biosynthetic protein FliO [Halobacillus sp. A5]